MLKGNIHRAIAILNIEDHCIPTGCSPALHNLNAVIAAGHQSGQVNGAHFEVFGDYNGFFRDRLIQNSWNRQFLARLQKCPMYV